MLRSRAALVVGLLIVLAAFSYGVENQASTSVAGQRVGCGTAISADWLVSGTGDAMVNPEVATSVGERRRSAACEPVVQRARTGVLSTMAAGALLALIGWTALSRPGEPRRVGRPEVRAT